MPPSLTAEVGWHISLFLLRRSGALRGQSFSVIVPPVVKLNADSITSTVSHTRHRPTPWYYALKQATLHGASATLPPPPPPRPPDRPDGRKGFPGTLQPYSAAIVSKHRWSRSSMEDYGWKYWWQSERSPRFVRWYGINPLFRCLCWCCVCFVCPVDPDVLTS